MKSVIVDTSVLIRIFDQAETAHPNSATLAQFLIKNGITVRVPFHAMFEISATLKRKHIDGKLNPYQGITEDKPLAVDPVSIDDAFFAKYFDTSLPYLKAGDLLFLAMAKKDDLALITEDKQQYNAAKQADVDVFTVDEYLADMGQ